MPSIESEQKHRRRRILKAAASAPVVFTLPSGAALAAASLTCAEKSAELAGSGAEPVPGVTTAPDNWMRFSLQGYTINQSGGQLQGFTLGGNWYAVNADGTVVAVVPNGNPNANGTTYYALVDYESYAAGNAQTMYVYLGTPIGSPIAGASCWNSLTGATLTANVIN